jgi:hypothetical protein
MKDIKAKLSPALRKQLEETEKLVTGGPLPEVE